MLDYLTNIFSTSLINVASIVIFCLLTIELISYIFLSRSFSVVRNQIKDLLAFKYPWNSIAVITWLLLALFSILFLRNTSPLFYTFLSAGIFLYFLGWLIRYQPVILSKLSRSSKRLRPFLGNYSRFWNKLGFHEINAQLFGPWLEIFSISIIAMSFVFFPAFFAFPLVLAAAIIQKGRKLAHANPNIKPLTPKDLFPRVGHVLRLAAIVFSIVIIVGITTQEFAIFYGDIEAAKSILFTLSQIEGGIGVLAITIIFVLTQLTASNYSIRVSKIFFRQAAFWIPLLILLASVTYNLLVASRLPLMLPIGADYFHSLIVDLSLVFGLATASGITFFIYKAPSMVSPESIITYALKSFDKEWLDTIKRDWCHPRHHIIINVRNDPFIAIERILSKAVDSGDSLTFVSGLLLIRDHLHAIKQLDPRELPNYIIEIDAYFRHHFRSLARTAAKNSDAYTLLQLTYFIEQLEDPSPESIKKCDSFEFGFDEAAGELLLREIIGQATKYQLTECVTRGIHIVESRATKVIATLPQQTETWLFNQKKSDSELPEEERKKLWANDYRVNNFETQYLSYLASLGVTAADSKSTEIVRSVSWALSNIISSIIQDIQGHTMKAMMIQRAIWNLDEITKASLKNKLSDAASLDMLRFAAEKINNENEEIVAWHLVHYISDSLLGRAKIGLLDFTSVVDSAMIGLTMVTKYTKPAIHLLQSMGQSAEILKKKANYVEDEELRFIYSEVIRRIRQVGHDGRSKDPAQISSVSKSILESLDEPEFEKKHKS
jgi:hypothetical protein